jgi:hypothetical protein
MRKTNPLIKLRLNPQVSTAFASVSILIDANPINPECRFSDLTNRRLRSAKHRSSITRILVMPQRSVWALSTSRHAYERASYWGCSERATWGNQAKDIGNFQISRPRRIRRMLPGVFKTTVLGTDSRAASGRSVKGVYLASYLKPRPDQANWRKED